MILREGLDQRILKDRNEIIKSIKENPIGRNRGRSPIPCNCTMNGCPC